MAIQNSVPDLLLRLATELDDPALSDAATGRIGITRSIRALDSASNQEYMRLRGDCGDMMPFKQTVTLTADSNDTDRYPLPPRVRETIRFAQGATPITPLNVYNTNGSGFVMEEGGRALRKRNLEPSGTISAWVIQTPCKLAMGAASNYTATTVVFQATPTIGTIEIQNDYYNGARVCSMLDGQIRTITDYVGSTRTATVATWDSTPSTTSQYCIMFDMPDVVAESVVLRAAVQIARSDKVLKDSLPDIKAAYAAAHRDARVLVDKMNRGRQKIPRAWWG